jgi:vancomycin resistance protein YoaR
MEYAKSEHSTDNPSPKRKIFCLGKPFKIILYIFLAVVLCFCVYKLRNILTCEKIYHGINISGEEVGGYTKEELIKYLKIYYEDALDKIELTFSGTSFEKIATLSEIGIEVDIDKTVQKAYDIGRTGSTFQRLSEIVHLYFKPKNIYPVISYETEGFNAFLDKICSTVYREVVPPNIVILEDRVVLCTGISGKEADREALKLKIISAVQNSESLKLDIPVIEIKPPPIDIETTLNTINTQPENAQFIKTSRTTYEIKPHQRGRHIDKSKLSEIVSYIESRESNEYEEIILPVDFIEPEITEEALKSKLFKDTLSTYTTTFTTDTPNNYNRSVNIGLASKRIDGTIIMPGDVFSFNDVVGPRTPELGYKIAHVYVDGQIRDGTGGGICQVSTTLYNAALRANLEIVERHNHMFAVGYVPLGLDAAVSYGYADLVFKNTTGYPLRIDAQVTDNTLSLTIVSTNEYPNLKVKLAISTIKTIPRKTQYVDDPKLPQGTLLETDKGMDGYVVDTFMKIYNNGILIKEEKLHRSTYQALPRIIRRGTAPISQINDQNDTSDVNDTNEIHDTNNIQ